MSSPGEWRAVKPTKQLKVPEFNDILGCSICGGYLIDATTVVECIHSCKFQQCAHWLSLIQFCHSTLLSSTLVCRSCILKHIKTSVACPHPNCGVIIHDTKPHEGIRSDPQLQDVVYKLVPDLYKSEQFNCGWYHVRNCCSACCR